MATATTLNDASGATEPVFRVLEVRGWSLEKSEDVKALITIQVLLADGNNISTLADAVEAELLNTDLRSIGACSLPDAKSIRKTPYIHGPKVLQIISVRDVAVGIDEQIFESSKRRLLRFILTDGKSEIVAIEFSPIPRIPNNVVPGTKICLLNKIPVRSGIVCLEEKMVKILGGVVQKLHDEWTMNQKYKMAADSSLKLQKHSSSEGPPPFEKLQLGKLDRIREEKASPIAFAESTASSSKGPNPSSKIDGRDETRGRYKQRGTEEGSKEMSQKLLQKMSTGREMNSRGRGRRHRGNQEDDENTLTLEEYEKMRHVDNQDEIFARQLQNQLDLEDSEVAHKSTADDIKQSIFYNRSEAQDVSRGSARGRGGPFRRSRGRGRRGGR